MPQLFFKKIFLDAIRTGRKTTTLRRWAKCRIHPGDRVYVLRLGWLAIGMVEVIEFHALGDTDAKADGFASLAELKNAMDEIYPDHKRDGKRWYRIHFEWDAEAVIPAKGKRRRKIKKISKVKVIYRPEIKLIKPAEKSKLAGFMRIQLDKAVAASGLSPAL